MLPKFLLEAVRFAIWCARWFALREIFNCSPSSLEKVKLLVDIFYDRSKSLTRKESLTLLMASAMMRKKMREWQPQEIAYFTAKRAACASPTFVDVWGQLQLPQNCASQKCQGLLLGTERLVSHTRVYHGQNFQAVNKRVQWDLWIRAQWVCEPKVLTDSIIPDQTKTHKAKISAEHRKE